MSLPSDTIIQYSAEREVFKAMDDAGLTYNLRMYRAALKDPRYADDWPAFKLGLELCIDELKSRNIQITEA